jgi:hypothetical protein
MTIAGVKVRWIMGKAIELGVIAARYQRGSISLLGSERAPIRHSLTQEPQRVQRSGLTLVETFLFPIGLSVYSPEQQAATQRPQPLQRSKSITGPFVEETVMKSTHPDCNDKWS